MDNNTPKYELAVGARVVVYRDGNTVVPNGSTGTVIRLGDTHTNCEDLVCITLDDGGCSMWFNRSQLAIITD